MKILAEYRHKNVVCQVLSKKESNVYLKSNGDFFVGEPIELAQREAVGYYNCPKNNKRGKKVTVIKEQLRPSSNRELNNVINSENAWVNSECKKIGALKTGGIFTMLKNKGY